MGFPTSICNVCGKPRRLHKTNRCSEIRKELHKDDPPSSWPRSVPTPAIYDKRDKRQYSGSRVR